MARLFSWQTELLDVLQRVLLYDQSSDTLFNFYRDEVSEFDLPGGAQIRWYNLYNYVRAFQKRPEVLVVGEAPGFRGCRFSGIPFTSEKLLIEQQIPVQGKQSSTESRPRSEATATVFWEVIVPFKESVFAWNTVPFHPHLPNDLTKNRPPTAQETKRFIKLLNALINALTPKRIIAVGNVAYYTLRNLRIHCIQVRHPSYGGKKKFKTQISEILS